MTLIAVALTALTVASLRRFRQYQPLADLGQTAPAGGLGNVGLQIQDATVTGREDGRMRWRVWCGTITLSRDRRQVSVDGVRRGLFYVSEHRPAVSIRAGHAVYATAYGDLMQSGSPGAGLLRLFGGIEARVLVGPGVTLQGDALTWDALRDTVSCPGLITARFPGGTATGQGLELDAHTGDLSLHQIHGTFLLPPTVQGLMPMKSTPRIAFALAGAAALGGASAAAPDPTTHQVNYTCGANRYLVAPHIVEMSQGVTFNQNDAYLNTEAAVVNLDDQQRLLNAKSQTPVHLYNTQDDLTGRQGFIDFTRHLATLSDNVVLVVKPGSREATAPANSLHSRFKDAATLTCALMTYDYRRKIGRVPGALTVHQKDRVLTADSGEYDTKAETITLVGNVHGHNGDQDIQASKAIFGLHEGAESITIPVPTHGVFTVKDEDDTTDDTAAAPAPAAPPAPTSSPTTGSLTPNAPPPAPTAGR